MYLRWKRDLKSRGFRLDGAVCLDFPGGMPGDIGLFLVWGEMIRRRPEAPISPRGRAFQRPSSGRRCKIIARL